MFSVSILRAFIAFSCGLSVGVGASLLWAYVFTEIPIDTPQPHFYYQSSFGTGFAACNGRSVEDSTPGAEQDRKSFQIISKPRPNYTDDARQNSVQGTIVLRVAFLASGNIGAIEPIRTLPDGLTEQAIEAAKQIRFEPKRENGRPVSITRHVEYTFTIY